MENTIEFTKWLQEDEINEGILKNIAATAGLGVAGLGLMSSPSKELNPPTSIGQRETKYQDLLDVLNKKYKLRLTADDLEVYTPEEKIAPMYGSAWGDVLKQAQIAQKKEKFSDIFYPSMTDVQKMRQEVPVIFANPALFGSPSTSRGVCRSEIVNGESVRFCVVKRRSDATTIRHELSHMTQNPISGSSTGLSLKDYVLHPDELGVRLAEMKRNYFQLTGIIATSDDVSIKKMLMHFLENSKFYSSDVQQLVPIISSDKKSMNKVIEFFKQHIDKVVMKKSSRTYV